MSPRTLRLVLVFLTGFVLLAYAPVLVQAAPTVGATLTAMPVPSLPTVAINSDLLGDILLGTAAAMLAVAAGRLEGVRVVENDEIHQLGSAAAAVK